MVLMMKIWVKVSDALQRDTDRIWIVVSESPDRKKGYLFSSAISAAG
jgi:hypothetical protein